MIVIKSDDQFDAFTKSFKDLYLSDYIPNDLELFKEEYLVVEIDNSKISDRIKVNDQKVFVKNFDYDKYIIGGNEFALHEGAYWYNEMFESSPSIDVIIDYLRNNPFSKRAIKVFWKDSYRDLSASASCVSQLYFRIKYNKLEMHVLMRANDAYRCLLIDIDSLRAVQDYVAKKLDLVVGKYIHSVDSFHFYQKNRENIEFIFNKLI